MNCVNCGGALRPASAICPYCNTLNDIDLRGLFDVARRVSDEKRLCPHCATALEALDLGAAAPFLLDRCMHCLGLFFDPTELEALVKERGAGSERLDLARLNNLLEEETPLTEPPVQYIRCPTCGALMNRRRYGARAGVIMDECRHHGVWLDGGELRRIMQWVRAGGPEHQRAREAEQRRADERSRAQRRMLHPPEHDARGPSDDGGFDLGDTIATIAALIRSLL